MTESNSYYKLNYDTTDISLKGNKCVCWLIYIHTQKPLRKSKVVICNHKADSLLCLGIQCLTWCFAAVEMSPMVMSLLRPDICLATIHTGIKSHLYVLSSVYPLNHCRIAKQIIFAS